MPDAPAPPSPCINVCVLEADGLCRGCLRTLDEIARWMSMTPSEQRQVIEALAERRRQRSYPNGEIV
jgi:predicted Fe-S protein YdhL (DUF1289 family)